MYKVRHDVKYCLVRADVYKDVIELYKTLSINVKATFKSVFIELDNI